MEKFIPYEKLSKKEKRRLDRSRRSGWGELNPVTRKPANSRAYNRSKARNRSRDYRDVSSGLLIFTERSSARGHGACRDFAAQKTFVYGA